MAGGYTFDADAMADRIRQLEDVRIRIDQQLQVLRDLGVSPPSWDGPAGTQAEASNVSIKIATAHNLAMLRYAETYLDLLKKASGQYESQEGDSTGALFEK